MITDTQIISYYYKGHYPRPSEAIRISSITASEFLLVQSDVPSHAKYYPILPSRLFRHRLAFLGGGVGQVPTFDSKKHARAGKHRTDKLVLDFGSVIPSYVEFGSLAISELINHRFLDGFMMSIQHLDKEEKKMLRERFLFLLSLNASCVPISRPVATIAMNLLMAFLGKYQLKANQRNSINDLLILATAVHGGTSLRTEDNLLRTFTAEYLGVTPERAVPFTVLDFSMPHVAERRSPLESKGYIHRGWQISERNKGTR